MTTAKLRWGILGVARINDRLLPGFRKASHADLRAIASRDPARASLAAASAGIPVAHGCYEALLDDPAIDAVYIPLPNTLHGVWARQAASRGKHVLCEKPLTPTAAEARALVDFCRDRGVALMDGFMWPHHPRTACIRQLIDGGAIGRVERVSGAFTFLLRPLDPANIRLQPGLAGGSLLDVGCYPVYGIRWALGGEPVRVHATASYRHGVDLRMSGTVWLADGRIGTFDCGFDLPLRQWLEISGSTGVIRVPNMWLPEPEARFVIEREGQPDEVHPVPGFDQIAQMIDDFSQAVLQKKPVCPDPEEAVRSLRVLDALARSAREERVVGL
jgi:predicted dehydrogenase